ncbi:hypothetical protein [Hyalangium sp.]|uniref:hypothetical protein n=1 Tax=Hyalangium sp. TaxID=2028555 RepID=UPI002D3BDC82|nr:hypothetical protein [Hyalangium sp.]HYI02171.1 hypothetical protein [Hyalangium sp.]
MQPSFVLYIESLGHGGLTMALQPDSKNSSVELLSNFKGRQEVGYYEHALPAGTFARVLTLLDQVGFDKLPASPGLQPDTPTVSVGKMYAGSPPRFDMKGYDAANVPKALDPVRAELRPLIEVIVAHPVRAIRGEAAPVQPSFRGDEPVAFELRLENVGTKPLKLDNPFHKRMEEQLTVRLLVTRDKPAEKIQEKDQLWLDCTVEHVHTPDRKIKPPSERELELGPGAELRFVVRKKLMLQPGRYRAVIFFRNSRQKKTELSAPGVLGMDPGVFEVAEASP